MKAEVWIPACPEPWYVGGIGWRRGRCRCDCGMAFKSRDAYQLHWYREHIQDADPSLSAGVSIAEAHRLLGSTPQENDKGRTP